MGLKCGIIGLPNVGKSTLFNALTESQTAESANYPFCTIEPNLGIVPVPDPRLKILANIAGSNKIIPSYIEFVDIAGLVKGASQGEGLGNQFLSHIREVDALIHVVRCFDEHNISHVYDNIDPLRDVDIIETELMLADIDSLEKKAKNLEKKSRSLDKEVKNELILITSLLENLKQGIMVSKLIDQDNYSAIRRLQLLTSKKILYVCNVSEKDIAGGNNYTSVIEKMAKNKNCASLVICSKIEEEIANLKVDDEKKEFLTSMGLEDSGLNKIIKSGLDLLDLSCFFTVGPKEVHSWIFNNGIFAPQAAGIIHTDFEKGFIKAETISFDDYISYNGEAGAKDAGKNRLEGKNYIVQDGDILHFRFNR